MSHTLRHQHNLAALAELKRGNVNPDLLKSYTGWGGLREAVYTPDIYRQLKEVLTLNEIASLKKTLSSAYYTPKALVEFMYAHLGLLGFKGGKILEPAIGTGVFIEHMPEALRQKSHITGVELDSVSARICKGLYPDVDMHITGFEDFHPTKRYDLIIGNPPYGCQVLTDAQHVDLSAYRIHHYFAAKSMRLLKEGGLLAFVLPAFFMDNESQHVREVIASEGGEMISAYRLPDDLFADAKVTIDIVLLQKGKSPLQPGASWTKTFKANVSGYRMSLNEYYHANPQHIIGRLDVVEMYGRKGLTCKKEDERYVEKLYGLIEKQRTAALKESMIALRQELHVLHQALITTTQKLAGISQQVSKIETFLQSMAG